MNNFFADGGNRPFIVSKAGCKEEKGERGKMGRQSVAFRS
jgi:hypothetical protein